MQCCVFSLENQISFAKLSGDYNPLHVDPVAARRSLFGGPVVHGIHAFLWSLNHALKDCTKRIVLSSMTVTFSKSIRVGEEVSLLLTNEDDGCLKIRLECGGSIAAKIRVKIDEGMQQNPSTLGSNFPRRIQPRVLSDHEIKTDSGVLELSANAEATSRMFPHLARCVSPLQIAVILGTTRIVGVLCPGMHSIFSELRLCTSQQNECAAMRYQVEKFDERFGMVHMTLVAPETTGVIKAFRRPLPQKQEDYCALAQRVEDDEFAGQRALVIGGSRGLGEVAAKLLSAGGADVKITYYHGKEDAGRIVDDIVSNGGVADCYYFDVLSPKMDIENMSISKWVPTHLYYFATPFIFSASNGRFSPHLFSKFCDYYVAGFMNAVDQLSKLGVKRFFYPSTVAIDELPTNMGEYAAAKIAGETLCEFLEKSNRKLCIQRPRFPRVATDQTVSVMHVANQDPVPIVCEELRSFRDLGSPA